MPAGPSVQSNLHSKEITTAKVTAVSFGFFSDEEVRGESEVGRPELLLAHLRLRTRVGSSRPPGGGVEAAALPGRLRPGDWLPPPASAAHMQVRKFSVKQIVSPVIFDNLKNAVKGGLYDPAMGPMEQRERCGALTTRAGGWWAGGWWAGARQSCPTLPSPAQQPPTSMGTGCSRGLV